MKKLLLLFALMLTVCSTAMAQGLNEESAVGTIGTLDGREAMVVDLGGTIGKVAVATLNVGAKTSTVGSTTLYTDYGTQFTPADANDPEKNGLTDGWYVPSKPELEALASHLTQNNNFHCVEWKVTETATLYLPSWRPSSGNYKGSYVSSKKTKWTDYTTYFIYGFRMSATDFSYGADNYDESEYSDCAIRPFHKLPTVEDLRTIWYTSSDGKVVTPSEADAFGGATIVSNVYDEEKGMFRITFDGDVTSIGKNAFYDCSSLTSITLPSGVTSIGSIVFADCSKLTSITLPSGLTSIGGSAFLYCSSLASITLPSGLTSIGNNAFYGCSSLTSIALPSGVTSIGSTAFYGCSSLISIILPDGVTSIGSDTFNGCSKLTSITLPDGIKKIGMRVFKGCSKLTSIILPASLTEMGSLVFQGCTNLKLAVFLGTTPPSIPGESNYYPFTESGTSVGGTKLLVPSADAVSSYEAAGFSNVYESVTYITDTRNIVLTDIENARKGVTLTQAEDDIITACKAAINSATDVKTILQEKDKAISIINLRKAKDDIIAGIDAVLAGYTSFLTQEEIETLGECKQDIIDETDVALGNEKIAIVLTILKNSAKGYLQFHYVAELIKDYLNGISTAESWAEIDNCVQEAKSAVENMPHFMLDEKLYPLTPRTAYEYTHQTEYFGDLSFPDGVTYQSNGIIFFLQGTVEYTRTLPEGVWQCWYEPFDVTVDTEKFDAAEVADISFSAKGEPVVWFNKLENGATMKPNTIYVIRAKEGNGKLTFNTYNLFSSTENQLTLQSAYDNYTLTGNYSAVEHGDWYTLDGTGKFSKMASGSLKPQRFYLSITPRKDGHYYVDHYNAKPFINIMVLGDEEDVTGIESLTPALSEGKGVIYNLQGQRVTNIQKGQVYIVNGKKFLAK